MATWLVHYSQNGKKVWTTVEASSREKACSSLTDEGNAILIIDAELITDENEVVVGDDRLNDI
jgi:hypothetical protein